MRSDYPNNPGQLDELRKQITEQLEKLPKNVRVEKVAELIGAGNFLHYENLGRGKAPVAVLDVKSFCEHLLLQGKTVRIPESYINAGKVILPTDEGEIITGSGAGAEKKQIIPRDLYLVELLGELKQDYYIIDGENGPNMVRGLSYKIFVIPGLKKAVFVNNEAENMTFIVHRLDSAKPEEVLVLASLTKAQLKEKTEQDLVSAVRWNGTIEEWKIVLRDNLLFEYQGSPKNGHKEPQHNGGIEKAKEGFLTTHALAEKLDVHYDLVQRTAEKYRSEHPEWFIIALGDKNRRFEHFHPDLVAEITKQIKSRPGRAREGFFTNNSLAEKLAVDYESVKKIANQYRAGHPEWFGESLDEIGNKREYYHPDLVAEITKQIKSRPEKAKEGFLTNQALADLLGVAGNTILKITKPYHSSKPEWFVNALDNGNRLWEFLHPDLVALVTNKIKSGPQKAKEGFFTNTALAAELECAPQTVKKAANQFRANHPEWFTIALDNSSHIRVHYSPELVSLITAEIKKRKIT